MERAAVTSRFVSTVLSVSLLGLVVLCSTTSRAGEGDPKTSPVDAKVSLKSCFTLLNADKLPSDASPAARLKAAQVEVHWSHADGITLQQVLTDFGRTIDLPMIFLPEAKKILEAWEQNHFKPDEIYPIDGTLQKISARGYLDYLLYTVDEYEVAELQWELREGKIVISSRYESPWDGWMETRVHRLGELAGSKNEAPDAFSEYDRNGDRGFTEKRGSHASWYCVDVLRELVTSAINPKSWQENGGPGTIVPKWLPGAEVLVVRNSVEVQEQVALLFSTLEQMLNAKELVVECPLEDESARCFSQAMQQKLTLDVEEMPLEDVLTILNEQFGEQLGIPVLLDRVTMEADRKRADIPVTYSFQNKTLRCFGDYLKQIELAWTLRFGAIVVTSQVQAEKWLSTSVFEVTDLTMKPEYNNTFDMDSLIELITFTANREDWQEVGGPGTICPICFDKRGRSFLAIRQTESTMEEVRQLLAGLRAIRDKKIQSFPQIDKADREVLEKLDRKLNWDIKEGTTLPDFVAEIERSLDLKVCLNWDALGAIGYDPHDFKLEPICVEGFSTGSLLSLLLEPLESDWIVRHGEIFISTEFDMELLFVLYEVSDLTACGVDLQGNVAHDIDSVIELITCTANPEGWEECSGPGPIREFFNGQHSVVLAIRQTYKGHKEIAQLLADLRAAMPKDPAKRVLPVCYPFTMEGTGYRDGYGEPVGYFYHEEKKDTKENRSSHERPKKRERQIRRWFLGRR